MRALTVWQPWASLVVAGIKPIENRTWPVPRTLPQWVRCDRCGRRSRDGQPERGPGNGIHYTDACAPEWGLVGNLITDGPFPFHLAIHAGKAIVRSGWQPLFGTRPDLIDLMQRAVADKSLRGVLLGYATITGCHHASACAQDETNDFPLHIGRTHTVWRKRHCSRWADPGDVYHWVLDDPVALDEPIPMRGRQGLWTLPDLAGVPA